MMALQFFIQKVNFSSLPPPGLRVTGENIFFLQDTGKSFFGILAKKTGGKKSFSWFSRHFKTRRVDSVPPNTIRVNDVTKRFRRNIKRAFNGSFGFMTDSYDFVTGHFVTKRNSVSESYSCYEFLVDSRVCIKFQSNLSHIYLSNPNRNFVQKFSNPGHCVKLCCRYHYPEYFDGAK